MGICEEREEGRERVIGKMKSGRRDSVKWNPLLYYMYILDLL